MANPQLTSRRPDWSSLEGAQEISKKLREYWRKRGRDFQGDVIRITLTGDRENIEAGTHYMIFGIKSNMLNGYPPRFGQY